MWSRLWQDIRHVLQFFCFFETWRCSFWISCRHEIQVFQKFKIVSWPRVVMRSHVDPPLTWHIYRFKCLKCFFWFFDWLWWIATNNYKLLVSDKMLIDKSGNFTLNENWFVSIYSYLSWQKEMVGILLHNWHILMVMMKKW